MLWFQWPLVPGGPAGCPLFLRCSSSFEKSPYMSSSSRHRYKQRPYAHRHEFSVADLKVAPLVGFL